MCKSNPIFFQFFQLLSLCLNVSLCADLILTIQSPFTPASGRSKWYYGISVLLPTAMAIIIIITQSSQENGTCQSCIKQYGFIY